MMFTRKSVLTMIALAVFSSCALSETQRQQDSLPSISEVEKLPTVQTASVGTDFNYEAVCQMRGLFLAFQSASGAISRYRDPVLTRGSQGISVFKAVSPAVVLVVVGSVKG